MTNEIADAQTTRDALMVWGIWLRVPDGSDGPGFKTATRVMFSRANKRGSSTVLTQEQNEIGERMDRLMTALPARDKKVLKINFSQRLAVEIAANNLGVSRRTYEQGLAIAIGRVSVLMTNFLNA